MREQLRLLGQVASLRLEQFVQNRISARNRALQATLSEFKLQVTDSRQLSACAYFAAVLKLAPQIGASRRSSSKLASNSVAGASIAVQLQRFGAT